MLGKMVSLSVGVAALVGGTGCTGDSDPPDRIAASSARLKGHGTCHAGTCDWYFEWTTCTRPFLEPVCAPYAPERRRTYTNVTAPSTETEYRLSELVSGLLPTTWYRARICGRATGEPEYNCSSERDFTTAAAGQPSSPMYNEQAAKAAGAMSHPVGANQGRDVGNAVAFRDRALYYFGDTWGPGWWRTSSASYGQRGWYSGDFPALRDATVNEHYENGVPKQFVPYTASEPEYVYSAALGRDEHYYHWPSSNFVRTTAAGEEALVYWSRGGFEGGTHNAGMFVDRVRSGDTTTQGASGRWKLWPKGVADGYLPLDIEEGGQRYFIACKKMPGDWAPARCFLGRVAPANATNAAAYRYFNQASGAWQAAQVSWGCNDQSCPDNVRGGLFEASPYMSYQPSITWNPYLGKYLSVAGTGGGVELRVADRITGPWSRPTDVPASADGRYGFLPRTAAEGLDNYHAREHLQLRSPDAKTIVVSYFHAAEVNTPENRAVKLVKIELEK